MAGPILALFDIDQDYRRLRQRFTIGDYVEAINDGDKCLSAVKTLFNLAAERLANICRLRTRCYNSLKNPIKGFNAAFADSLTIIKDVMQIGELDGLQDAYFGRYAEEPELDASNREALVNLIERLQTLLDNAEGHSTKKRNVESRASPRMLDVWSSLPNELAHKILLHLETTDLARVALVSRKWHESVLALSNFLTEPHFPESVGMSDLPSYFGLCRKNNITSINAMNIPQVPSSLLSAFITQIADAQLQMDQLSADVYGDFKCPDCLNISVRTHEPILSLRSIDLRVSLRSNTNLNPLLESIHSLRSLSLHLAYPNNHGSRVSAIHVHDLHKLKISMANTSLIDPARRFAFDFLEECEFVDVHQLELESVPLDHEDLVKLLDDARPEQLILRSIDLLGFGSIPEVCAIFGIQLSYLSILDMGGVGYDENFPAQDLSRFSSLQHLELRGVSMAANDMLRILDTAGGSLRYLDFDIKILNGVFRGAPLTELLDKCPLLEHLGIWEGKYKKPVEQHFCPELSNAFDSLPHLKVLQFSGFKFNSGFNKLFPVRSKQRDLDLVLVECETNKHAIDYLKHGRYCSRVLVVDEFGNVLRRVHVV